MYSMYHFTDIISNYGLIFHSIAKNPFSIKFSYYILQKEFSHVSLHYFKHFFMFAENVLFAKSFKRVVRIISGIYILMKNRFPAIYWQI